MKGSSEAQSGDLGLRCGNPVLVASVGLLSQVGITEDKIFQIFEGASRSLVAIFGCWLSVTSADGMRVLNVAPIERIFGLKRGVDVVRVLGRNLQVSIVKPSMVASGSVASALIRIFFELGSAGICLVCFQGALFCSAILVMVSWRPITASVAPHRCLKLSSRRVHCCKTSGVVGGNRYSEQQVHLAKLKEESR